MRLSFVLLDFVITSFDFLANCHFITRFFLNLNKCDYKVKLFIIKENGSFV